MFEQTAIFKDNVGIYMNIISKYLVSEQGWTLKPLKDCIDKLSFTIPNKLLTKEYSNNGKYPIISQGKSFIEAYTDNGANLVQHDLPLIIFGDHTKQLKYIDFPFVLGADGVKLLKPKADYYPKLFFYLLYSINLPKKSYSRHYKYLCDSKIAFPSNSKSEFIQEEICTFLELLNNSSNSDKTFFNSSVETQIKSIQRETSLISSLKHKSEKQFGYISCLRQAVLQEAIEGKLTAEWRTQNLELISGENHASKLLEKIKSEKERLIKEGKIKKDKPFPPITDEEKPFNLPKGWVWCRLGEACEIEKGNLGITKAVPGNYPLVALSEERLSHISYQFDCSGVVIPLISSTGHGHASMKRIHYQEGKFSVGSILCCVYPKYKNTLNMKFIYIYLDMFKERFFVKKMRGAANVSLSISSIAETPIPLIPIDVQNKFNQIMNTCDELEKQVTDRKTQSEMLMQSVLREAFSLQGVR